jgi:hypothetical protein
VEASHTLLHGVNQATCGGNDGHCAVLHGVQLDQPAGLEPAGILPQQEQVP